MRSLRWPRPLFPAHRPQLVHSWWSCRPLKHRYKLHSTVPSVLDSQGRPVYYEPPLAYLGTDERVPLDRWLQPGLVSAVKEAFPAVKYATTTQQELFYALTSGRDIMLQTPTGSGKSFSLMLAMMSQERKAHRTHNITSLIIVPHRDLAYQYLRWIQRIHAVIPELGSLESIVQIMVRDSSVSLENRLEGLRAEPPHILIGTPQALMDAYEQSSETLMLTTLSSVVVDEIDYLIDWIPQTHDKYKRLKAERMIRKHPTPTRQLLDAIYRPLRAPVSKKKQVKRVQEGVFPEHFGINHPQLVMTSATFRASVRRFLSESGGWFHKTKGWMKISSLRKPDSDINFNEENRAVYSLGGTSIQHHVLVVSKTGMVRNIKSDKNATSEDRSNTEALQPRADCEAIEPPAVAKTATEAKKSADRIDLLDTDGDTETLPFSQCTLEAIAEAFALDVPRLALLVLPASAPVVEIIGDLRELGVNAQGLNVLDEEAGGAYLTQEVPEEPTENPTLLVSTLATTRGLDLPSLTHVFVLGLPKDRPGDAYMHAAGRVGRFGRSGKVITVIEERRLVTTRKGGKRWVDQPTILRDAFKLMGVVPTKLSHFV